MQVPDLEPGLLLAASLLQPPGRPPNATQLVVMQGTDVPVTQQKGNFFMGDSDSGYTIW